MFCQHPADTYFGKHRPTRACKGNLSTYDLGFDNQKSSFLNPKSVQANSDKQCTR